MSLARKLLASGAALAAVAAVAGPALAGTVIASSGPSAAQYRVGAQIGNSQRVTLRAGDSVTVLDNGGTRVLSGPGTFVLARQSGQASNRAFAALTTQRTADRARIASVRGEGGGRVSNPHLWYVDIARSGTVCLQDPANVRLWRADTAAEAALSIKSSDGETVTATFPEKEMLARWEAVQEPREGVAYTIGSSEVTFRFLVEVPDEPEAMAQTLIAHGCTLQLEQLAAAMPEDNA